MNFKKAAMFLLLALLNLFASSCMDGEESVYSRVDEYGVQYSPTYMRGTVHYLKNMKPEKVKIVRLDEKLNSVDFIEAALDVNDWGEKNILSGRPRLSLSVIIAKCIQAYGKNNLRSKNEHTGKYQDASQYAQVQGSAC